MVTLTGFEPVDAALRGLRLKPLVDRASAWNLPKPKQYSLFHPPVARIFFSFLSFYVIFSFALFAQVTIDADLADESSMPHPSSGLARPLASDA